MIDYYFSFNENIERIELIHHGKPVEYADGKTIGMPIRKYADDVSVPVKSILKTMKRDLSNSIGAECESFEINGSNMVASFKSSGFTKPATTLSPSRYPMSCSMSMASYWIPFMSVRMMLI